MDMTAEELNHRTCFRVHHDVSLIGMVSALRWPDGHVVYSAGTMPPDRVGALKYGLSSFAAATQYADQEAKQLGHRCDERCGAWPSTL